MLNILIADDNIDYARSLMHFINSTSDNVRVSDISVNGKETLEILNRNNNIDIILLDLKMPFLNGLEILNQLSTEQVQKYTNSIIIISGETQMIQQLRLLNYKMIYKILPKTMNLMRIIDNINELILDKNENDNIQRIRVKISNELTSIGYSLSHNGTQYLIDIIEMTYFRGENLIKSLNKYVYPLIAQRYNESSNNIKTCINRATEAMYYNCQEKTLQDYFCLNIVSKPNIKTVINTVLLKLSKN